MTGFFEYRKTRMRERDNRIRTSQNGVQLRGRGSSRPTVNSELLHADIDTGRFEVLDPVFSPKVPF